MQVALLSAVITTFITYVRGKIDADSITSLLRAIAYNLNKNVFEPDVAQASPSAGAPAVLLASEYIPYLVLLIALASGVYALSVRLMSVLTRFTFYFVASYKISPPVIWFPILSLCGAVILISTAAVLQLLVVVDIFSASE